MHCKLSLLTCGIDKRRWHANRHSADWLFKPLWRRGKNEGVASPGLDPGTFGSQSKYEPNELPLFQDAPDGSSSQKMRSSKTPKFPHRAVCRTRLGAAPRNCELFSLCAQPRFWCTTARVLSLANSVAPRPPPSIGTRNPLDELEEGRADTWDMCLLSLPRSRGGPRQNKLEQARAAPCAGRSSRRTDLRPWHASVASELLGGLAGTPTPVLQRVTRKGEPGPPCRRPGSLGAQLQAVRTSVGRLLVISSKR